MLLIAYVEGFFDPTAKPSPDNPNPIPKPAIIGYAVKRVGDSLECKRLSVHKVPQTDTLEAVLYRSPDQFEAVTLEWPTDIQMGYHNAITLDLL